MRDRRLKFSVRVPPASKNSRQLARTSSGALKSFPSRKAKQALADVRAAAVRAVAASGDCDRGDSYFGPDDEIGMALIYDVAREMVDVEIWAVGPKPVGKTGRGRDIDGFASTIMDGLNGVAYGDDRQLATLTVVRSV